MLWRHNCACIAWYKHGNWPITACIRHNLYELELIEHVPQTQKNEGQRTLAEKTFHKEMYTIKILQTC